MGMHLKKILQNLFNYIKDTWMRSKVIRGTKQLHTAIDIDTTSAIALLL